MECKDGALVTSLCYLKRDLNTRGAKLYRLIGLEPTPEIAVSNIEFSIQEDILVTDFRGFNHILSLEANAYKLYYWPANLSSVSSEGERNSYCNNIAERLRQEVGAETVFTYDRRSRKSPSDWESVSRLNGNLGEHAAGRPLDAVHLDQTPLGGPKRIRRHLTSEEADKYLSGDYRVRIINVWRCFTQNPDKPLALCDPSTVMASDLVAVDTVTPKRGGEMYYVRYNPKHRWFWASGMTTDEVLAFTTFDSKFSNQATNCCIHTAFPFPPSDIQTNLRESFEIRMIVFNAL
ncbi:hypothetical protein BJ875DRAFT_218535 [Amylocarpus encephaloides]|uniref:Methyltransferase n=1 Tax=Amylocarpus encephaloides TaxID=45428 RepID=A0A9P8BZW5_9HELO|nr:hypothetical protein BJ875DRAFT_218535 [Amylocarpus encephaloides]